MARATAVLSAAALLAFSGLAAEAEPGSLAPSQGGSPLAQRALRGRGGGVTTADVEVNLVSQLAGNVSKERLDELEAALRPMYAALPKEPSGYIGHQAVQYALHRLLLQRHGWFILGLEPTDEAPPPYLHGEWVPQYLQGLLEQRLGERGINLREIAALAATLEDLVRAEAVADMDKVYERLQVPASARVDTAQADRVLETYMMLYLNEGNSSAKDLDKERETFKLQYSDWDNASSWLQHIKDAHIGRTGDGKLGHTDMLSIANELGERFGKFNDGECSSLKKELLSLEGSKPGRVPLVDFYQKGLYSHWQFNEKMEYLRVLGALDESDKLSPSVLLPNYLGSRSNCLTASDLYAVCCRNECEDIMGSLERKIAAPTASPQQIQELVAATPSDTTEAPRELPQLLVQRLQDIAAKHGGKVPLHGRLFAQWMHHAYPRECPYPHEGGANPQTPDEWMAEAEGETRASEGEVRKLLGGCATAGADGARCSDGAAPAEADHTDLPWSDAEVLLTVRRRPKAAGEASPWWPVAGKVLALLALLAVMRLHADGRLATFVEALGLAGKSDAMELPVFEDDRKPGSTQWRPWKLLLCLVVVGGVLEVMGLLDRFSFGCTMALGLLVNIAPALLMRQTSKAGGKLGKCI